MRRIDKQATVQLPRSSGVLLHPTSLPAAARAARPSGSSTGSRRPASRGGRCCRSARPTPAARPTRPRRRSPARPRCSPSPRRRSRARRSRRSRARHAYWSADWAACAGDGALADQVRFEREWGALRAYAAERGVRLIGDLPIYVAAGGGDHRSHPELFREGSSPACRRTSTPRSGQLWGNPVYDWAALRAQGYRWWIERFRRTFELVDVTRLDHFRGFVAYWAVPAGRADGARRHVAPRRRARAARGGARGARRAAADRREPRRDHAGRGAAAARVRPARHGRPPVRASTATRGTRTCRENHGRAASSTRARTTTTRRSAGGAALAGRERARRACPREPALGADRAGLVLPRRGSRSCRCRTCSGSAAEARMNTPGRAAGNWGWRLRGGRARRRARGAAAGTHRRERPPRRHERSTSSTCTPASGILGERRPLECEDPPCDCGTGRLRLPFDRPVPRRKELTR